MAQYFDQYEVGKPPTGKAEQWFKSALGMAPGYLPTRQVVCLWALQKGKLDFAKEQAEAALHIEDTDSKYAGSNVGHMLRGEVALWEKKWEDAEKNFQWVILQVPNDFAAKNNLALALVEQNDTAKKQRALDYAEANYRDHKDSPDALSTLGWVYFRRGQFDLAGMALDQSIKATGGNLSNPDTATYVAHILYHQDKPQTKWQAKQLLEGIVVKSERPFSMRPEAKTLYEKVKDTPQPVEAGSSPPKAGPG